VHDVGDALGREAISLVARSCGSARAKTGLVEQVGDLRIDMILEESIDERYDL
jgi:hypothetical protein